MWNHFISSQSPPPPQKKLSQINKRWLTFNEPVNHVKMFIKLQTFRSRYIYFIATYRLFFNTFHQMTKVYTYESWNFMLKIIYEYICRMRNIHINITMNFSILFVIFHKLSKYGKFYYILPVIEQQWKCSCSNNKDYTNTVLIQNIYTHTFSRSRYMYIFWGK